MARLPIRLMMEGVITREQMQRGTVIVNGVEHVGRMFEADPTIDRASVELCTELFTDDVMVAVANSMVKGYELALYRRHPSGIDRWYPHSVPVAGRQNESQPAAAPAPKAAAAAKPKPQGRDPARRQAARRKTAAQPVQGRGTGEVGAEEQPQCPAHHAGRAGDGASRVSRAAASADHPSSSRDSAADGAGSRDDAGSDRADPRDRTTCSGRARRHRDRRRGGRGHQASIRRYRRRPLTPTIRTSVSVHPGWAGNTPTVSGGDGEEGAQQGAGLVGTHAAGHRWAVVEPWIAAHLVTG